MVLRKESVRDAFYAPFSSTYSQKILSETHLPDTKMELKSEDEPFLIYDMWTTQVCWQRLKIEQRN